MDNSYIHNLWQSIVLKLNSKTEIQTVRLDGNEGVWFSAYSINGYVEIKPFSNPKNPRKIVEKEFTKVYPCYQLWKAGKILRKSMRKISLNTSYILALINHFEKESPK